MSRMDWGVWILLALAAGSTTLAAQAPALPAPAAEEQRLAAGDLIAVSVFETPELTTEARLDPDGNLTLPVAGTLHVAGLTAAATAAQIARQLGTNYLRHPQVTLLVREFATAPVTVLGAVRQPGVYSARNYPTLGAVLAAAGGVTAPATERVVLISPGGASRELGLRNLEADGDGTELPLQAGDTIRVVPAATVYVGGDVLHPGAYALPASGLTVLSALSLAGGPLRDGRAQQARIVTHGADGTARAQAVDAAAILQGRMPDQPLRPNDLLYIPHSQARATMFRGLETLVATGSAIVSGVIIFH